MQIYIALPIIVSYVQLVARCFKSCCRWRAATVATLSKQRWICSVTVFQLKLSIYFTDWKFMSRQFTIK